MRMTLTTAAAILALGTAACSREDAPVTANADVDNGMMANDMGNMDAENAAGAMPIDAAGFAAAVAASDLFEIESGKLAQAQGTSADVKGFAAQLQSDHGKSTADLKAAAQESGVMVNPALDAEKQAMLDALKAARGAEFDRLFIDQQATAHQKALQLLQHYGNMGDNTALKAFATKAATVVEGHLEHVNRMKQ